MKVTTYANPLKLKDLHTCNTEPDIKPNYYRSKSGQDVTDIILDFDLDFLKGNVLKYVIRAGLKTEDPIKDIDKAIEYLNRIKTNYEANCEAILKGKWK